MTEFLIYKYPITRSINTYGAFELRLPLAARILSCQIQNDQLCFWVAFCAPDEGEAFEVTTRNFQIIGTGKRFESLNSMEFIATVQQGSYVWHIFEEFKIEFKSCYFQGE